MRRNALMYADLSCYVSLWTTGKEKVRKKTDEARQKKINKRNGKFMRLEVGS